jgi:hypothetical protein
MSEETVSDVPMSFEEVISQQSEMIDTLLSHFQEVEEMMLKATALLNSWKPGEEVLMEVKFLVLGKMEEADPERLERLQAAATWLDLFQQGEP